MKYLRNDGAKEKTYQNIPDEAMSYTLVWRRLKEISEIPDINM